MIEQVTGAASILVIWLAYVVIVECLTAVAVLLAEFIWHRVRSLRPLLPSPRVQPQGQEAPYQLGGSLVKWQGSGVL
jgi:hypothetical protein